MVDLSVLDNERLFGDSEVVVVEDHIFDRLLQRKGGSVVPNPHLFLVRGHPVVVPRPGEPLDVPLARFQAKLGHLGVLVSVLVANDDVWQPLALISIDLLDGHGLGLAGKFGQGLPDLQQEEDAKEDENQELENRQKLHTSWLAQKALETF